MNNTLQAAYAECLKTARAHYENFPVASYLMPRRYRIHVAAIYAFARRADDLADEGDATQAQRIDALQRMSQDFDDCLQNKPAHDYLFIALAHTIRQHQLDPALFRDLLSAFKQDVSKRRYKDFDEVLDYCRRSANPVGRLLLQLFNEATERNNRDADNVCSALQLINFLQDIRQDLTENDRLYFPQVEMQAAGVKVQDLKNYSTEQHVVKFVHRQTHRARRMLLSGAGLGRRLPGRFGLEIRAIISGGLHICDALLAQGDNIYSRPRLTTKAKLAMLLSAVMVNAAVWTKTSVAEDISEA